MEGVQAVPDIKRNIKVSAVIDDYKELKRIVGLVPKGITCEFTRAYGRFLSLLYIEVDVDVLSALTQFWNSNIRCFEFSQFDAVPTLEEYTTMMDCPIMDKVGVYLYKEQHVEISKVIGPLNIPEDCLKKCLAKDDNNQVRGLKRNMLEKHLDMLVKMRNWAAFKKTLLLIIFGVVLFPRGKTEIDRAAMDAYFQFVENKACPIPAVLAETLRTVDVCRNKKKQGNLQCCLQLLYVWIITHCYVRRHMDVSAPIALVDFHKIPVKKMTVLEWKEEFAKLESEKFFWVCPWYKPKDIIIGCGSFHHVPLMGTRGCISYTPIVALRQLRQVQVKPLKEQLGGYNFAYTVGNALETNLVKRSWKHVHRKKIEGTGTPRPTVTPEYTEWREARDVQIYVPKERMPTTKDLADMTIRIEELTALVHQLQLENEAKDFKISNLEYESHKKDQKIQNQTEKINELEEDYRKCYKMSKRPRSDGGTSSATKFQEEIRDLNMLIKKNSDEKSRLESVCRSLRDENRRLETSSQEMKKELESKINQMEITVGLTRMAEIRRDTDLRAKQQQIDALEKEIQVYEENFEKLQNCH
ncbi:uncharacterized protein LOC130738896 [Lotus japonicus]|uniref:uncharacterized protein LOC130738896 n=1 Tax=Lotus japonicus TaxID=34305 RepID=UPI0025872B04|nr:uncharacterized protein LOC130738896 [Lotus japonicus]